MSHKPRNRFDPPKRTVPFRFYVVCLAPFAALFAWREDAEISLVTMYLVIVGLTSTGRAVARFILSEWADYQDYKLIKEERRGQV